MSNIIEFTIKGTDKFSGVMGKVDNVLTKVVKTVTKTTGVVLGAEAALFALTKRMTAAEDRAAKFAKRLGLAVEELTAIEFAAERSGLSVQQADMSMQRLERRSAEAAKGMGEAQGALRELGIDARSFTRLGIEDKMAVLARQLEGVDDAATRTRIAFKLFDSEGVAMLQMLGDGEDAFRGLTGEARQFGAVISAQAAANAEKFQDSLTNMTTVLGSVFRGVSDELAPIFTNIMDRITNFFVNNRQLFVDFTKNAIRAFFTVLEVSNRVFQGIGDTIEQLTTYEGFKNFAVNFKNAFLNIFESALATFKSIGVFIVDVFKLAFDAVVATGEWAWENIKSIFSDEEGPDFAEFLFRNLPAATAKARKDVADAAGDVAEAVSTQFSVNGTGMAELFNINLDGISESVDRLIPQFQTFGEVAAQSMEPAVVAAQTLAERVKEIWDQMLLDQGDTMQVMAQTLTDTVSSAIDGLSQGIANAVVESENLLDVVKNVAKGVLKEVIAMFVKMGAQRLATALLSKSAAATEASAEAAKAVGLSFANTLASWSGAPWPISMAAPAMAATNAALAATGFSAGAATGAGLGAAIGAAAGGMDFVPSTGTYLIHEGERIIKPEQNRDLTEYLQRGGQGVSIGQLVIHMFENATNADSLLSMDPKEVKEIVAEKLYRAMDELDNDGVRPRFAAR